MEEFEIEVLMTVSVVAENEEEAKEKAFKSVGVVNTNQGVNFVCAEVEQ